jgi:hypothetical protein
LNKCRRFREDCRCDSFSTLPPPILKGLPSLRARVSRTQAQASSSTRLSCSYTTDEEEEEEASNNKLLDSLQTLVPYHAQIVVLSSIRSRKNHTKPLLYPPQTEEDIPRKQAIAATTPMRSTTTASSRQESKRRGDLPQKKRSLKLARKCAVLKYHHLKCERCARGEARGRESEEEGPRRRRFRHVRAGETFELPFPNGNPRERESERSQERRRPFQWSLDRSMGVGTSEALDLTNWRTVVSRVFLWTHFRRLSRFLALARVGVVLDRLLERARAPVGAFSFVNSFRFHDSFFCPSLSWESSLFSCALWRERRTITVIIRRTRSRTRRRPREDPLVRRNAGCDERRITTC